MKKSQLNKLEKLARRMSAIEREFQALSEETRCFDYAGNGILASGRVSAAASVLNTLCNQLQNAQPSKP